MKTHVTFVLDSSGSMESIKRDTIGGFNSFLQDQQDEEGEATVTLYNFNTTVELLYRGQPIEEATELDRQNYQPGGSTALHDAIARSTLETKDRISSLTPPEQPDHVVIPILTDGKENASSTPQERVRELVKEQQAEEDWEYLFIGANQDAALTAEEMGMDKDRSLDMADSGEGADAAYESLSENISEARQSGNTGGFDNKDRRRQEDARE
jgi:Mg-chelatase subunit ChlD